MRRATAGPSLLLVLFGGPAVRQACTQPAGAQVRVDNKDARGMMTDGEVLQVTAGPWAMWAVADMWALTGSTTWIESQDELDRCSRHSSSGSVASGAGCER